MTVQNVGRFVWHEYFAKDPKAGMAFYTDVVGWKTQPFAEGNDYTMWMAGRGPVGGTVQLPEEAAKMGAPTRWIGNVVVENVDVTAALCTKLGGKVLKTPEDVPTVGRFAVIADPQGGSLAIFTPIQEMPIHNDAQPGEFCWNELLTTDEKAAFAFYSQLFGWKTLQEMDMGPMGTYRIYGVGEQRIGGMMNKPKDASMPPTWVYYTETTDLDGAIARATKQGAKLMNGPHHVPTGARIAQLMDAQGAVFALHEQPKKN